MKVFGTRPDGYCAYRLITIALSTIILAGCETLIFSSLYVSEATANATERHSLPILEDIDRIEIQKEPMSLKADLMASNLVNSRDIANLVRVVNSNRSSWKNSPLDVTPPVPNLHPVSDQEVLVSIHFWKKEKNILKVNVNKSVLMIQMGSRAIHREISKADADEMARVIDTSSYTTRSRPVNQYRLLPTKE